MRAGLFGRDTAIADLRRTLLDQPGIFTVTGPGGVGKTSLVDHAAANWDEWSPWTIEPVRIDLSELSRADMVLPAIAHALGISESPESSLPSQLAAGVSKDVALLVLDNFEHVLAAGREIAELAQRCPQLRIAVTSRVPLRTRHERVIELAPLPLPDDTATFAHPTLALFASVSCGTDPDASIEGHEHTVARICRRLDGLPLAIELAAARSATLGPAQIESMLSEGRFLAVLRDGPSHLPDRHRDLGATVAWSYGLLGVVEQRLAGVLSGFAGWFDLDDVAAVAGAVRDGIEVAEWLDALSTLVRAHLVTAELVGEQRRYRITVPVREFCDRHAAADLVLGERSAGAHRARVMAIARDGLVDTEGSAAGRGFARLQAASGDLMRALDAALASEDAPLAAAVAPAVSALGFEYGLFDQLLPRLRRAIELLDRQHAPLADRAQVRGWLALLEAEHRTLSADPDRLAAALLDAAALARDSNDIDARLRTLMFVTLAARTVHNFESAAAAAAEGVELAESVDRVAWLGRFEVEGAMVLQKLADDERATALGIRALERGREIGDQRVVVRAVGVLRPPGARTGVAPGCPTLDDALTLAIAANDAVAMRYLYPMAAAEWSARGDRSRAAQRCADGLSESIESGSIDFGRFDILVLAAVLLAEDEPEISAELLGAIEAHWPRLRLGIAVVSRQSADRLFPAVAQSIGADAYEQAVSRGAARSPRDALIWALDRATHAAESRPASVGALTLTSRELDVLRLVSEGRSNKEIAVELGITRKTAMHHTSAIYRKLQVRTRLEAAAVAHRSDLLTSHRR